MKRQPPTPDDLIKLLRVLDESDGRLAKDKDTAKSTLKYSEEKSSAPESKPWITRSSFWPPRVVDALKKGHLSCFFGAGLSIPSGLPLWSQMLQDYFGLDASLLSDDDLQNDPLTQAELASHRLGAEQVQEVLRARLRGYTVPAVGHCLLAALRLPVYVTSNYDCLFEEAFREASKGIKLHVVTSDSDLDKYQIDLSSLTRSDRAILFKIHGSLDRESEHMILTRTDYRRHYRSNHRMFEIVEEVLGSMHVLFLGFSHRDPEITRLVENAIYKFESSEQEFRRNHQNCPISFPPPDTIVQSSKPPTPPNLYSLQFNMRSHTPEIYAARGIVALEPPLADPVVSDFRSSCLTKALYDLSKASEDTRDEIRLDDSLDAFLDLMGYEISETLNCLDRFRHLAAGALAPSAPDTDLSWLREMMLQLGTRAGQGVYLLDDSGRVVGRSIPEALCNPKRQSAANMAARPYFREAHTFREPFVSNAFKSIFNDQLTIAFCLPLITDGQAFDGLLFAACQPGAWVAPIDAAMPVLTSRDRSLIAIDANGVLLFPCNSFIPPEGSSGLANDEPPGANLGYRYDAMLSQSRRDWLISRIRENIVPLRKDDDVLKLGIDLKQYSVVAELPRTRWKIAVSEPIFL